MASKVIIVTGMHRSGTSVVANYLNQCGLNIGRTLHNSQISNAHSAYDGHHEDKEFLDLHRQILKKKFMPAFPTDFRFRLPVKVDASSKKTALKLIASRSNLAQWGWKDPRTTLFLDFWHELLENPKYLFLFRHPLAVVDSLIRRGTDKAIIKKPIIGLRGWNIYNQIILDFWRKHPNQSLLWEIDHLIKYPNYLLKAIAKKFQIELNGSDFEQVFVRQAFQQNLEESQIKLTSLQTRYPQEVAQALKLYSQLQHFAQNQLDIRPNIGNR